MKKFLITIGICFLSFTIFQLVKTFAVFETSVTSDDELDIAKWTIYVNNQNLTGTVNTFLIDDITYLENNSVATSKFAPGVSGYFILEIDPKDTEVAIDYEINFNTLEDFPHVRIASVEGLDGKVINFANGKYSRTITLSEIQNNEKDRIKVNFVWDKNDLYNDVDSELGLTPDSEFAFPVQIKFMQHIN